MKHVFALFPLLALSACTTFEPLRPDMGARPIPSRLDEIAYINGLRAAYQTAPSSALPCYNGKDLKAFRPKFEQGFRETDEAADKPDGQTCLAFQPRDANWADVTPNSKKATKALEQRNPQANRLADYLDNGFGLADLYCSRFMVIAAETRQARKLQKSSFAAVDLLMGTVLNAVSAGADLTNSINSGFGLIGSTYDNIDNAFVITPEKDTLVRLVQAAQSAFRQEVRERPAHSFAQGRSYIEKYSSMCTFDGMRGLVEASLAHSTDTMNAETKEPNSTGDDAADQSKKGTKTGPVAPVTPPKTDKPTTNAILPAF
ncbi:MAG: hypothetical protein ABIR87_05655 [Sphingomicrobium sp.]